MPPGLRQWRATEVPPFAALNADPAVSKCPAGCLTYEQSAGFARRAGAQLARRRRGLWALERADGAFLGGVGVAVPALTAHFTPCVEIAWPAAREHCGGCYATEAARDWLRFASGTLTLPEVVSLSAAGNARSRALMQRLGMRHDALLRRRPLHRVRRCFNMRAAAIPGGERGVAPK